MPRWVLPLLILIGLYVLSVGPMVAHYSRETGGQMMVPSWLRSYGTPYRWAYNNSPQPLKDISDGYFEWCKGMREQVPSGSNLLTPQQAAPLQPPPILPIAP